MNKRYFEIFEVGYLLTITTFPFVCGLFSREYMIKNTVIYHESARIIQNTVIWILSHIAQPYLDGYDGFLCFSALSSS